MKKNIIVMVALMLLGGAGAFAKKDKYKESYNFQRGLECYSESNYSEAYDWLQKELEEHPDNPHAHLILGDVYFKNEMYGEALSTLEKALDKMPKKDKDGRATTLYTMATVHLTLCDTVAALDDYARAITINPTDPDLYETRGQIYYELEKYDLSDADYNKMLEMDSSNYGAFMGLGRNAAARKRWDDAIARYDYVVKMNPEYPSGYSFRAEAYMGKEDWTKATNDLIKGLELDDMKAFYLLISLPAGDAQDMMATKLKIQMNKSPQNAVWPYCLGVLAFDGGEFDRAIPLFEKADASDPSGIFRTYLVKCYIGKKDYARALAIAEEILAESPGDTEALDLKASCLASLGRLEESLADRDLLIAAEPENPWYYLLRGLDKMDARLFGEAVDDFDAAVALQEEYGRFPLLLERRGDALRLMGKADRARADYEAVLEVEKDSVITKMVWTPFAHSGLGNTEKAVEIMEIVLANDTIDRPGTLYNTACLYARIGDKKEAMRYLREAVDAGYNEFPRMEVDYDLDPLRDMPEYRELMSRRRAVAEPEKKGKGQIKESDAEVSFREPVYVPFTKESGVTKVKCEINGLPLHFVFDTGASDVTMSEVEANFMLKNDYIRPSDIVGSQRYVDANGVISEGTVVILRKVNFGGLELDNVRASVIRNQKAPLLLGQSVLGRLGKIEIDNANRRLKITRK